MTPIAPDPVTLHVRSSGKLLAKDVLTRPGGKWTKPEVVRIADASRTEAIKS